MPKIIKIWTLNRGVRSKETPINSGQERTESITTIQTRAVFNEVHATVEGRVDWTMSNKPLDKKIISKRQFPQKRKDFLKYHL